MLLWRIPEKAGTGDNICQDENEIINDCVLLYPLGQKHVRCYLMNWKFFELHNGKKAFSQLPINF